MNRPRRWLAPTLSCLLLLTGSACSDDSSKETAQASKSDEADKSTAEAEPGDGQAEPPTQADPAAPDDTQKNGDGAPPADDAAPAEPEPAPDAEPDADPASDEAEPKTGSGSQFELLGEGEGDKQLLRLSPTKGQVERMEITMSMELTMDFGAAIPAQTQKTPPITLVNTAETVDIVNGKITERVTFDSFSVDDTVAGANQMMASAMKTAMSQIEGFEQTLVYDERGTLLEGDLKVPAGADPQVAQSLENIGNTLEQVMIRFPEVAVGVGAKWRETTEIDNNGVRIEQTTEYTIASIEGDTVTFATRVDQRPLSKKLTPPGMPPGVTVKLVGFESEGEGEVVYEQGKMLPKSGKSEMDTTVEVEASGQGPDQKFSTRIQLTLELRRLDD